MHRKTTKTKKPFTMPTKSGDKSTDPSIQMEDNRDDIFQVYNSNLYHDALPVPYCRIPKLSADGRPTKELEILRMSLMFGQVQLLLPIRKGPIRRNDPTSAEPVVNVTNTSDNRIPTGSVDYDHDDPIQKVLDERVADISNSKSKALPRRTHNPTDDHNINQDLGIDESLSDINPFAQDDSATLFADIPNTAEQSLSSVDEDDEELEPARIQSWFRSMDRVLSLQCYQSMNSMWLKTSDYLWHIHQYLSHHNYFGSRFSQGGGATHGGSRWTKELNMMVEVNKRLGLMEQYLQHYAMFAHTVCRGGVCRRVFPQMSDHPQYREIMKDQYFSRYDIQRNRDFNRGQGYRMPVYHWCSSYQNPNNPMQFMDTDNMFVQQIMTASAIVHGHFSMAINAYHCLVNEHSTEDSTSTMPNIGDLNTWVLFHMKRALAITTDFMEPLISLTEMRNYNRDKNLPWECTSSYVACMRHYIQAFLQLTLITVNRGRMLDDGSLPGHTKAGKAASSSALYPYTGKHILTEVRCLLKVHYDLCYCKKYLCSGHGGRMIYTRMDERCSLYARLIEYEIHVLMFQWYNLDTNQAFPHLLDDPPYEPDESGKLTLALQGNTAIGDPRKKSFMHFNSALALYTFEEEPVLHSPFLDQHSQEFKFITTPLKDRVLEGGGPSPGTTFGRPTLVRKTYTLKSFLECGGRRYDITRKQQQQQQSKPNSSGYIVNDRGVPEYPDKVEQSSFNDDKPRVGTTERLLQNATGVFYGQESEDEEKRKLRILLSDYTKRVEIGTVSRHRNRKESNEQFGEKKKPFFPIRSVQFDEERGAMIHMPHPLVPYSIRSLEKVTRALWMQSDYHMSLRFLRGDKDKDKDKIYTAWSFIPKHMITLYEGTVQPFKCPDNNTKRNWYRFEKHPNVSIPAVYILPEPVPEAESVPEAEPVPVPVPDLEPEPELVNFDSNSNSNSNNNINNYAQETNPECDSPYYYPIQKYENEYEDEDVDAENKFMEIGQPHNADAVADDKGFDTFHQEYPNVEEMIGKAPLVPTEEFPIARESKIRVPLPG